MNRVRVAPKFLLNTILNSLIMRCIDEDAWDMIFSCKQNKNKNTQINFADSIKLKSPRRPCTGKNAGMARDVSVAKTLLAKIAHWLVALHLYIRPLFGASSSWCAWFLIELILLLFVLYLCVLSPSSSFLLFVLSSSRSVKVCCVHFGMRWNHAKIH